MSASQPTALLLKAPRELAFEPLESRRSRPDEVRIRTLYSGVSAGTELSQFRGTNPFMNRRWDETSRLFVASARAELDAIRCATWVTRKRARSSKSALQ